MLLTPIYWVETGNATAHRLVNLRLEKQQRIPMNANCDARARGLGRCRIWLLPVSFLTLRDGACRRRLVSTNIGSSSVRNRLQSTTSRPSTTNPMDGSWLFVWCWFEVNLDAASFPSPGGPLDHGISRLNCRARECAGGAATAARGYYCAVLCSAAARVAFCRS